MVVNMVMAGCKPEYAPEYGTGWHRHKLGFHVIYMVSGWARFVYEGKPTLVETGDFVNMPLGMTHYLYD
jgi:quercetin dioxygenase-like cupin family protein